MGARISAPAPDRPRTPAPLALGALDLAAPRAAGAHLPPPPWVQPGKRVQGTEPVAMQPSSSAGAGSTAPPGSWARGASAPDLAEPNFPSQADLDPGFTSPSTPGAQGMRPAPHPHAAPPICDWFPRSANTQQPQKLRAGMAPYLFLFQPFSPPRFATSFFPRWRPRPPPQRPLPEASLCTAPPVSEPRTYYIPWCWPAKGGGRERENAFHWPECGTSGPGPGPGAIP